MILDPYTIIAIIVYFKVMWNLYSHKAWKRLAWLSCFIILYIYLHVGQIYSNYSLGGFLWAVFNIGIASFMNSQDNIIDTYKKQIQKYEAKYGSLEG